MLRLALVLGISPLSTALALRTAVKAAGIVMDLLQYSGGL